MEAPEQDIALQGFLAEHKLPYNPFGESRVKGLFFPGGQRLQTRDQIIHLINYSELILSVCGEAGQGKSLLAEAIAEELQGTSLVSLIASNSLLTQAQLVDQIIKAWQVPENGLSLDEKISAVTRYADAQQSRGVACILLVDDADQLNVDVLQLLIALSLPMGTVAKPVRLVLFGDFILSEQLVDACGQATEGHLHHFQLEPLLPDETAEYVNYRLATAGFKDAALLSVQQLMKVHHKSKGVPSKINREVTKLLVSMSSSAQRHGSQKIDKHEALPYMHIAAVLVIGVAVLLSLFYEGGQEQRETEILDVTQLSEPEDPKIIDVRRKISAELESRNLSEIAGSNVSTTFEDPLTKKKESLEKTKNKTLIVDRNEKLLPKAEEKAAQSKAIPVEKITVTQAQQTSNGRLPLAQLVSTQKTKSNPTLLAPSKSDSAESNSKALAGSIDPKLDSNIEPKKVSPYRREDWLLGLKSRHYTLQVLGTYSEEKAVEFINAQRNRGAFSYFQTSHKGRGWFVVLYGEYPDRPAALAAIPRLDQGLRKLKPWSRSLASVQQDIRKQLSN